jgi:hypothetical protein
MPGADAWGGCLGRMPGADAWGGCLGRMIAEILLNIIQYNIIQYYCILSNIITYY